MGILKEVQNSDSAVVEGGLTEGSSHTRDQVQRGPSLMDAYKWHCWQAMHQEGMAAEYFSAPRPCIQHPSQAA